MTVEEKAVELVEENRVILEPGDFPYVAIVAGHTAHYHVTFEENDAWCTCEARGRCSHILAAMIRFHEEESRFVASMEAKPW